MSLGINMVGLAAFAAWTVPCFTVPRRLGWVKFLAGVGILALLFSIVSPDDDGFQQELIRPATPSVRVSAHTRVAPQRSPADLSITAVVEVGDPSQAPRTGRSFVLDQSLKLDTHVHAPIRIHSPPIAS